MYRKHVFVCTTGKTCPAQGSEEICSLLRQRIAERGLKKEIRINKSGCLDQCGHGPVAVVYPEGVWYARLKPEDIEEIVEQHLLGGKPVERCLYDRSGRII